MTATMKESGAERMVPSPSSACRKPPFLSELVWFPVLLCTAFLHVICKPLGIEREVSMLISGGLFGLLIIPVATTALAFYLIESTGLIDNLTYMVGLPFFAAYVVQVLLLDKSHLHVKRANPHRARNAAEQASKDFFASALSYLPMTVVPWSTTAKLPTDQQYVFAVHPHGIHCLPLAQFSTSGSDFDKKFPGLVGTSVTGLCASIMFHLPLVRELFLFMGYVDASRVVANKAMDAGRSIYVCTGGEEESLLTEVGQDVVVLNKRKGFVRLALAHGASLVPVFGVGNSDLYQTYPFFAKQRRWLQKTFGIALPLFHGRWMMTPLPYRIPVRVCIGEPIPTPTPKEKGARPDEALVEKYHAKYIAALTALHAKHVKDRKLRIV